MSYRYTLQDDRAETHEDVWLSIHLVTESSAYQVSFLPRYMLLLSTTDTWEWSVGELTSPGNKHMKGPRKHHLHLFEFNTEP